MKIFFDSINWREMEYGKVFRVIRKALQMNQSEFAELFGLGIGWATKLETGNNAGFEQFTTVARILIEQHKVSPYYILTGKGPVFIQPEDLPQNAEENTLEARVARLERILAANNLTE